LNICIKQKTELLSNLLKGVAENLDDADLQRVVGKFAIIPILQNFKISQFAEVMRGDG